MSTLRDWNLTHLDTLCFLWPEPKDNFLIGRGQRSNIAELSGHHFPPRNARHGYGWAVRSTLSTLALQRNTEILRHLFMGILLRMARKPKKKPKKKLVFKKVQVIVVDLFGAVETWPIRGHTEKTRTSLARHAMPRWMLTWAWSRVDETTSRPLALPGTQNGTDPAEPSAVTVQRSARRSSFGK